MNHETVWTRERVERLEELWACGYSAALVAREIGSGVTRSAVLGKVSRLKLAERPTQPHLRVKRQGVDPQKIVAVCAMRNEGMEVAQALGVSRSTVVKFSPLRTLACARCGAPFEKKGRRYCCDGCAQAARREARRVSSS